MLLPERHDYAVLDGKRFKVGRRQILDPLQLTVRKIFECLDQKTLLISVLRSACPTLCHFKSNRFDAKDQASDRLRPVSNVAAQES
jgi:hypothetical protein